MFEAWTLRAEAVKDEEEALREKIRQLDDKQRQQFYGAYNKQLKDPDTYAVLNWLFLAGLHHFYLGRWARGMINLLLMLGGIAMLFFIPPLGMLMILLVLVIELPALFRSQVIVADFNNQLAQGLLGEIR